MSRRYTAQDMREIAERMSDYESGRFGLELYGLRTNSIESEATDDVASMLRQAADDMEREEKRERKYEVARAVMDAGKKEDK